MHYNFGRMFNNKFIMIVFFLVAITILHHGSAKKTDDKEEMEALMRECENLLSQHWFKNGEDDGINNFIIAYRELTFISILNYFNVRVKNESPDQTITRLLKNDLFTTYFMSLASNHGIRTDGKLGVERWCKKKVKEVMEENNIHKIDVFNNRVANCIQSIIEAFQIDESMVDVHYKLFENFYHNFIANDVYGQYRDDGASTSQSKNRNDGASTSQSSKWKNTTKTNYPLNFYQNYEELLEPPINTIAHFQSIAEFCKNEGLMCMLEKAYYVTKYHKKYT